MCACYCTIFLFLQATKFAHIFFLAYKKLFSFSGIQIPTLVFLFLFCIIVKIQMVMVDDDNIQTLYCMLPYHIISQLP